MLSNARKPCSAISLALCGLLLAAFAIASAAPASAMGMMSFRSMSFRPMSAPRSFAAPGRMPGVRGGRFAAGGERGRGSIRERPRGHRLGRVWGGREIGGGGRRYRRREYGRNSTRPALSASASVRHGGGRGSGSGNGRSGSPPRGAGRFVPDEVIIEFAANASPQAIGRVTRRFNLSQRESQNFPLLGATLSRWHIGGRRSVPSVVGALQNQGIVAAVQPNYIFALQEQLGRSAVLSAGDPAQYVLRKLQVEQAQRIATGKNVPVAVIDSKIDGGHPDLGGSVVKSFDALTGAAVPQLHGTEMAGAIASHGKLLGIAPGAQVLAARAFDDHARGTSFAIYKSLQWAADNGARVVNMSFAGPADPDLHRMLAAAAATDIVLVAAAGNGGADSAPLYPAADPSVIAVTATDIDDHVFKMANRGTYIAVAAPGVDILALAPGDAYQLTTGTSVAAAHVSGVAALLLQHDPSLKPADIRGILMTTAKPLASGRTADFGAGVVNAYRAVTSPASTLSGGENAHRQAKR